MVRISSTSPTLLRDLLPLTSPYVLQQTEYHNKSLTRLLGGPQQGCYVLAITIFTLGLFRDALYERALRAQPFVPAFYHPYLAYGLLVAGNTLVLTSYYQLGITGTFLGDYFGILKDEMVTGFPFNVTGAPMYWGSTASFLGSAILYGRPAGALLTIFVYVAYSIALRFEDPFTSEIYARRDRERKDKGKKKI